MSHLSSLLCICSLLVVDFVWAFETGSCCVAFAATGLVLTVVRAALELTAMVLR